MATIAVDMFDGLPTAFSARLAHERGVSDRRLRGYVEAGLLERLGHGVYRKTQAPPADLDRIEIAIRAPDATLCLTSALAHHDLTDAIPSTVDLALPRSTRPPRVSASVRWHRFQEATFFVGRESMKVDEGVTMGLYGAERCIIDAFRLGHREGQSLAAEAVRRWLRRRGAAPARLLEMARHFPNAEPAILHALRLLS